MDTAPDIVVRSDSADRDCGYPWSAELGDGRVLVVYYYVYSDGVRGIEGTLVEEELPDAPLRRQPPCGSLQKEGDRCTWQT